jgi:hypothetical protein
MLMCDVLTAGGRPRRIFLDDVVGCKVHPGAAGPSDPGPCVLEIFAYPRVRASCCGR